MIRGVRGTAHGVPFGLAILTSFYEVLTTMAAGALIAALVFFLVPPPVLTLVDWLHRGPGRRHPPGDLHAAALPGVHQLDRAATRDKRPGAEDKPVPRLTS